MLTANLAVKNDLVLSFLSLIKFQLNLKCQALTWRLDGPEHVAAQLVPEVVLEAEVDVEAAAAVEVALQVVHGAVEGVDHAVLEIQREIVLILK